MRKILPLIIGGVMVAGAMLLIPPQNNYVMRGVDSQKEITNYLAENFETANTEALRYWRDVLLASKAINERWAVVVSQREMSGVLAYEEVAEDLDPPLNELNAIACTGGGERVKEALVVEKKQEEAVLEVEAKPAPLPEVSINIYPNPFREQATVAINNYNEEPYTFELYDLTGKRAYTESNIVTAQYTIQRKSLTSGIYIYRMLSASTNINASGKLVVQ